MQLHCRGKAGGNWSAPLADIVPREVRSRMMAGIRGKDTKPELIVRRALHGRGLRFRLHRSDLPGRPDIVLPKYRTAIFVNGCFWHGHDCPMFKWPKTREAFWRTKIEGNKDRDADALVRIANAGWNVEVVWECELRSSTGEIQSTLSKLYDRIRSRLSPSSG